MRGIGLRGGGLGEGMRGSLRYSRAVQTVSSGGGGGGWGTFTASVSGGFTVQSGYPLANAFDNNASTAFATNEQGPGNVDFHFTGSGDIVEVRLTPSSNVGNATNFPATVALYYSDDGTSWTQKGSTQTMPYPATGVQVASFSGSAGAHAYWRLAITLQSFGGLLVLAEIELADVASGPDILG